MQHPSASRANNFLPHLVNFTEMPCVMPRKTVVKTLFLLKTVLWGDNISTITQIEATHYETVQNIVHTLVAQHINIQNQQNILVLK